MSQTPTLGRIVLYVLTQDDADAINRNRSNAAGNIHHHPADGTQVHVGNGVVKNEVVSAIIVKAWNNTLVNLKCMLDGNDDYWCPSKSEGSIPGSWYWPSRVG